MFAPFIVPPKFQTITLAPLNRRNSGFNVVPAPIAGPVGMTATATAHATDSYGNDQTLSGGTWSTDSPSIMTVNSSGGVHGVAPGQVNLNDAFTNVIVVQGNYCHSDTMPNCQTANPVASGPGTVVWVTLSLRTTGSASLDDSARDQYSSRIGTYGLGTLFSTGINTHAWRTGVEIVGTVSPSNFTGTIILQRRIDASRTYNVSTLTSSTDLFPDTSDPTLEDSNPQSGGSNGIVYDLDAPSLANGTSNPVNTLLRVRTNFREWATLNGVPVSYDFLWFSRISVIKTNSGDALSSDVPGDNVAGTGTTNVSWNLQ